MPATGSGTQKDAFGASEESLGSLLLGSSDPWKSGHAPWSRTQGTRDRGQGSGSRDRPPLPRTQRGGLGAPGQPHIWVLCLSTTGGLRSAVGGGTEVVREGGHRCPEGPCSSPPAPSPSREAGVVCGQDASPSSPDAAHRQTRARVSQQRVIAEGPGLSSRRCPCPLGRISRSLRLGNTDDRTSAKGPPRRPPAPSPRGDASEVGATLSLRERRPNPGRAGAVRTRQGHPRHRIRPPAQQKCFTCSSGAYHLLLV